MILANIEAAIEAKEKERERNLDQIDKIYNLIKRLQHQKAILLDRDTDLYYEIEELKEQLHEGF